MNKKRPVNDEYNWAVYTQEYSAQAEEAAKSGNQGSDAIVKHSYATKDGLVYKDNLHDNWKNVYSTIRRLRPKSVFECGCGGMHHLYNIKKLMPGMQVNGCDLLQTQVDWGKEYFNIPSYISNNVGVGFFPTNCIQQAVQIRLRLFPSSHNASVPRKGPQVCEEHDSDS